MPRPLRDVRLAYPIQTLPGMLRVYLKSTEHTFLSLNVQFQRTPKYAHLETSSSQRATRSRVCTSAQGPARSIAGTFLQIRHTLSAGVEAWPAPNLECLLPFYSTRGTPRPLPVEYREEFMQRPLHSDVMYNSGNFSFEMIKYYISSESRKK